AAEVWKEHLVNCKDLPHPEVSRKLLDPGFRPQFKWADAFLVHLFQALRDHGPDACLGMEWLEKYLAQRGHHPGAVLRWDAQRQAATQVTVGNCVTCLRLLSALDWSVFFERTSLVETILRGDPARVYARQDFATKDRYRKAVEILS